MRFRDEKCHKDIPRGDERPSQTDLFPQIFNRKRGVASNVLALCVGVKFIFCFSSSEHFFDIKRFFLKAVTVVDGPLLRWMMCYVKRVPLRYSASNLALYFLSLPLNSTAQQSRYDNRRLALSLLSSATRGFARQFNELDIGKCVFTCMPLVRDKHNIHKKRMYAKCRNLNI